MSAGFGAFEILAVTHKYPPSIGGMQKQSYELIRNLESFAIVRKIIFKGKYPKAVFFLLAVPRVLFVLLRHRKIRVIHANDGLMAFFLTPLLLLRGYKLSATLHGLDVVFDLPLYRLWLRHCLSRFHILIAVSIETRSACINAGIPANKVYFVPNGFEKKPNEKGGAPEVSPGFSQNFEFEGKALLCSIGRPVRRKGFVWFVQHVVPRIRFPFVYVIVGPAEKNLRLVQLLARRLPSFLFNRLSALMGWAMEAATLEKLANTAEFSDKVIFTGSLSQQSLDSLLEKCDLFVMPNLPVKGDFEGFGLVALEAASRGIVCLASRVDGIPSAIRDGETGYLLKPGAEDEWANRINEQLSEPEKLRQQGQLFKEQAKQLMLSWHEMADAYYKLFAASVGVK